MQFSNKMQHPIGNLPMSGIQQHPNPSSIHATVAPVQLPPSSHPHDSRDNKTGILPQSFPQSHGTSKQHATSQQQQSSFHPNTSQGSTNTVSVSPVQLPPSSHPHDQHAFTAQFQAGQWTSISSEDSQEQLAGMSQACDYSTHYLPHL